MLKRSFQLLLVACLATGALSAAENPDMGAISQGAVSRGPRSTGSRHLGR